MHLESGTTAHGRYRIQRLLGEGGFGAAYLCSDLERFEKPCVLKELRPELSYADKASELFEREAKVLLSLSHPSIPSMHAFFQKDERFYLVQEFVDGTPLDQLLRERGALPEAQVRGYVVQVLEVLRYLHSRNPPVIHRDIKPSNLIVDGTGRVYVIDFGAVREAMTRMEGSAATVIGTPGYTPLEQGMGSPVPSSDIYALGATALHLVSGVSPNEWHDRASGRMTTLSGKLGCSAEFERVLKKMLAELPDQRFPSASDALEALAGRHAAASAATESGGSGASPSPAGEAALPTKVTSQPSGGAAGGLDEDPWAHDPSGGRASVMRKVGIGAGVFVTAGAVWFITSAGAGSEADEPASANGETEDTTVAALPLPLLARTTTSSGLDLSVNYPATWQLTTDQTHIAIRDPGSGAVFVTGMERRAGPQGPPSALAAELAEDPGERYGQIAVTEAMPPSGDTAPFRINVFRGGSADPGTLVIRQFTSGDETFSLWWMTIGNSPATTPTVDAMAQTLTTSTN